MKPITIQIIISIFIPLLHLTNQRKIDLHQQKHFGDIEVELLKKCKINDITIVTGSLGTKIKIDNVSYVKNKFYSSTEQNYSVFCARNKLNDSVIISFADIIYDEKILKKLINFKGECGIAVRKDWKKTYRNRKLHPVSEADNVLLNGRKIIKIKTKRNRAIF